jgi:EF-1 guanine nucleotide exchange domain
MKVLEESVRSISQDGLVWGSSTLVPVGMTCRKRVFF